jgi:hypothetical protein
MSLRPVPIPSFGGGLNLTPKVDLLDPSECVDCLNVTYTETGAVKQRDGTANFTSSPLTNSVDSLEPFYKTDGTARLIAGCGTRVEVLNTSGGVVASGSLTGMTSGKTWDFARYGSPNNERVYAGNGNDTIRRWDETGFWSAPANTPKAGALCVQGSDNRLVAAKFDTTTGGPTGGAGTSSPSHIYFSDAGDPETWTANNFVQLTPSDGEKVQAVVAWREFVFAFKETKFAVFSGNSLDASGNPIFNYHMVESGEGLASPRAYAVAPEGIYFMSRNGVYLTNGREPKLVSPQLDPVWLGGSSGFYHGGELSHSVITNCAATYHQHRLYLGLTTSGSTNDKTLVYDPRLNWWSLYDFPASCLASFRISSRPELVFGRSSTSNDIRRHNSTYTNDAGSAITSRWTSGWTDFGSLSRKVVREQKLWGSGRVSFGVAPDYQTGGSTDLVDLTNPAAQGSTFAGTGTFAGDGFFADSPPGLTPAVHRVAVRGTVFSTTLSNSLLNQAWSVDRLQYHLRPASRPSIKETEQVTAA